MAPRSQGSAGFERCGGTGSCRTLPTARARAQPHMPRRRKSISPLRASGGSASPSMAVRRVSYWATAVDAAVEGFSIAPGVITEFFSTDDALDRPWMHIEAELLLDQSRQLACPDRFARNELCPEKRQYLGLDLVRTARAALLWHQPRDARFLEVRPSLVIGRPRDAVLVRSVGHRSFFDGNTAQHLVLDLYDIARIEKVVFPKLRIVHPLGCRIQRALFAQRVHLRALAIVVCRHVELRESESLNVTINMPHHVLLSRRSWLA